MKIFLVMKTILALFLILITVKGISQNKVENDKENNLYKHNLSSLITNNNHAILGFIGDDYQKMDIKFISVIRNSRDTKRYFVYGKSRVKSNICKFQGELIISSVSLLDEKQRKERYEEALKHDDEECAELYRYPKGKAIAKYTYYEDSSKRGTGVFAGTMEIRFFIKDGKVFYDDLEKGVSDSFYNNSCVGTWQSYKTTAKKRCNWGEYRIPSCGDLDIGAGEFSPNPKYLKNGWELYNKAYFYQNDKAKEELKRRWW